MELWTGLIIGFLGSLHCIGMCGPIAASLPSGFSSRTSLLIGRVLYNAGRTVTYALLGILFGFIGRSIALAGFQQTLSIVAGITILLAVLLPSRFLHRVMPSGAIAGLTGRVRKVWGRMFRSDSLNAMFVIGLLNGLLPCGFLYVGLAAAAATGSPVDAAVYMLLFGLGTTPALFAASLFGPALGINFRRRLSRVLPVGAVVLGMLLVLRGMSLGIPYISPDLTPPESPVTSSQPSCH